MSPYFRALFSKNFEKMEAKTVKVDFEYPLMKNFLCFLYSGRLSEENVKNWPEMFRIAMFYGVDILARECELQIMTRVKKDMESLKIWLKFAIIFSARKLMEYIIKLVRKIQITL